MGTFLLFAMAVAAGGVRGDWVTPGGAVVRVEACGAQVCAKLVRLPPNPPATVDGRNPDASLRTRPLCGMNIGTGFEETSEGKLDNGRIYDPESGKTYKSTVTADGDRLKLRGYIGISLLGRTETWKRIATITACQ